jgi:EmrB/QacA subfamily drug resistance transporter
MDITKLNSKVNRILLATALLGTFFAGTATRIFNISMPTVAAALDTDLLGISWALLAYQLSNIGLSMVFGRLADRWGRARIFGAGFAVFATGSLLCGLSQSIFQLIAFRLIEGIGASMLQSSSRALAAEAVPDSLAGRAQGFMTTAHHTGFLLGPALGGIMIDYLSWRWAFFFLATIGSIGAVLTLGNKKYRKAGVEQRPVDYPGAALVFAVVATLILLLDRRALPLFGGESRVVLALAFVVLLVGFVAHEKRTLHPFFDLSLFKTRMFSMSALSLLIVATCYALYGFLLPFYLQGVLGLSPSFIGVLFMAPAALTLAFAQVSGYLSDRVGPRLPASLGVGFLCLSFFLGGLLRVDSHWLLPTLIVALGGVTNGLFNPANSVSMISMMPKEHRGFAASVNHVVFGMGNVLGIALGGVLMTTAFENQTGIAGAGPTTDNAAAFVSALNATLLAGLAVSAVGIFTSAMRGEKQTAVRPVYD